MKPLVELALKGGVDTVLPMPNTLQGLLRAKEVQAYIQALGQCVPNGQTLTFLPCIMLTERTTVSEIHECIKHGIFDAKIYPRGRTVHSSNGVRCYEHILNIVRCAGRLGMRCHFHPEHPSMTVPDEDAEYQFFPICDMFLNETEGVIIWEHGTDARCIPFWEEMAKSGRFYVTLTAHHLATNKDDTFGDVRAVCKPPIKTRRDQKDLLRLVADNYDWVMAGADDAPHPLNAKFVHQGKCACGAYTAPLLAALYAHALDDLLTSGREEIFKRFTSENARRAFNLPPASRTYTLRREPCQVPTSYEADSWTIGPFWAGENLKWTIVA